MLSLIAGLALSVMWLSRVGTAPTAEAAAPPRQAVLVTAHPVAAGTLLRREDLRWRETAAGDIHAGNLLRGQVAEAEFAGAIVRRDFGDSEPLIASDLVRPNERQFLAAALKPGMRAVSIAVDAPQSAAGLILPGDQVDVILTQTFGDTSTDPSVRSVAETVLRDVRVIATDQSLSTAGQPQPAAHNLVPSEQRTPRTVTFEVTEKQAERLVVASQLGRLQLSVRSLEIAPARQTIAKREVDPTWAADVSPALNEITRRKPQGTASGIEAAIRRPPPPSDMP
ncbi:Flp pilus assembly protein CpaB [Microbacteriaceae bacterium K1510]|nr:Flp pilus assembly protein CpaB [Microbacteriaceae bacterium K1510]